MDLNPLSENFFRFGARGPDHLATACLNSSWQITLKPLFQDGGNKRNCLRFVRKLSFVRCISSLSLIKWMVNIFFSSLRFEKKLIRHKRRILCAIANWNCLLKWQLILWYYWYHLRNYRFFNRNQYSFLNSVQIKFFFLIKTIILYNLKLYMVRVLCTMGGVSKDLVNIKIRYLLKPKLKKQCIKLCWETGWKGQSIHEQAFFPRMFIFCPCTRLILLNCFVGCRGLHYDKGRVISLYIRSLAKKRLSDLFVCKKSNCAGPEAESIVRSESKAF